MKAAVKMSVAAACLLLWGARPAPSPVLYSVGVADAHSLAVEIRLAGDADGETRLDLPDHWAGTAELWRGISGLTVEGGAVTGEGQARFIHHRPGAPLVIRYRVETEGDAAEVSGEKARPIVHPTWFFFHGEGVFATVDGRQASPVRFRWGAIPAGWKVASDLDRLAQAGGRLDDLVESAALGGRDVALATRRVGGAPLTVAVQGMWRFAPADLLDRVAGIVAAEHSFWREPPQPFLVTLVPTPDRGPNVISFTGTGRGDAFTILSTPNLELGQATRVLAHEYMHHWVPNLLGGLPRTHSDEQGREYWFSEGFDDYLTARVLLRSRIWSAGDWFADKNEVLLRYATSPARAATGAEIAAGFWKDENIERISYDRGHLLALMLDARIRRATGGRLSLDDVLRAQRRATRRGGPTAATLFPAMVRRLAGIDIRPDLERYAVRGEPFLLPADLEPACLRVVTETRRSFTRGFDIAATEAAGMSIRGVDPVGPAYAAGIRDGMKLIRRESGKIGDSTQEIAYRIAEPGGERVIRYLPAGRESFQVQRFEPAYSPSHETAACRARLGGA